MELKDIESKLASIEAEIRKFLEKRAEELLLMGKASEETKTTLDKLGTQWKEISARLLTVEQSIVSRMGGGVPDQPKSLGEIFVGSDGYKAMQNGAKESGKIKIGSFHTKTITNATGQNQPLVPDFRMPGIIGPGLRRLTVRDLLPNNRTTSNLIQYTKENVFTNSAAMQAGENVAKAESNITFTLANAPVQTLAHWLGASRQVLDDSPALEDYINSRLMFGLKQVEEDQLLTGDGTGQNLSGLITNATAYNRGTAGGDVDVDIIRKGKTQVQDSFFEPDAVIIHPHDWERIELTKATGTGNYLVSVPQVGAVPRLWGLDVVPTPAIPVGKFLVGAFRMAAAIWDRWDATIELSREHQDFFIKNMVAILCEERLALTVFRPLALVYGTLPQPGS